MKARYLGACHICKDAIDVGTEIARCNGLWAHLGCRETVRQFFKVTTLPTHRGSADAPKAVTSTRIRRDRQARINPS